MRCSGFAFLLLAGCAVGAGDELPSMTAPPVLAQVRPDTPNNNLLFRFDPSDVVETSGSSDGNFLIHYTRSGPNAVPAVDADSSGVPDFVEQVAMVYVEVLQKYHDDLGFLAPVSDDGLPDNGGDGRFDVYLVDFNGMGDGNFQSDVCGPANTQVCAGYMIEENDFYGYGYPSKLVANRILGSHEFFHGVQAAYDNGQGSVFSESTAVWATYQFDPSLGDFEGFLPGYFSNPDRPLDTPLPGPVDPFSYGAAIFPQYLEERYGPGTVRSLWERCVNGAGGQADPVWLSELDPLLQQKAGVTFAQAFTDFATWNLFTGDLADPTRSYVHGADYPSLKMNQVEPPYSDDELRVFHASAQYFQLSPGDRTAMSAALVAPPGSPQETDGLSLLLAVQRGDLFDPVKRVSDVSLGTEAVDTHAADELVVVVVNGLQVDPSRKPGLCIGTVDEVASCRKALTGGGDAGGGGGSPNGTGGEGGQETTTPKDSSGCGCGVADVDTNAGSTMLLVGFASAALRRRRRRVS